MRLKMSSNTSSTNKIYLIVYEVDLGYHVIEAHSDKRLAETRLEYFLSNSNPNEYCIEEFTLGQLNHLEKLGKKANYIIPYGSRVYEVIDEESDYNVAVISTDPTLEDTVCEPHSKIEYKIINKNDYQTLLDSQDIVAIEVYFCESYFARGNLKNLQVDYSYKVDKKKICEVFTEKSNNCWIECKNKLTQVVGHDRPALKSLFHSFRILYFGIQLCTHGKIVDYKEANHIYDEIMKIGADWEQLDKHFKPLYDALYLEFKKATE